MGDDELIQQTKRALCRDRRLNHLYGGNFGKPSPPSPHVRKIHDFVLHVQIRHRKLHHHDIETKT